MLVASLERNLERRLLRIVESPGARTVREYTGAELLAARGLVDKLSLRKDDRVVLILLPHSPELFLLQIGLVLSGRIPAVLPWPTTRVDAEKYRRNLLHQLGNLPAHHLLTLPRLADDLRPSLSFPVTPVTVAGQSPLEDLFPAPMPVDAVVVPERRAPGPLPADALFLQFSGGTTGTQKCVVVTAGMLEEQVRRLSAVFRPMPSDGVISWLPLYHDMGLIACLYFPLCVGMPSLHFAAADWVLRPELLFRFIEDYSGSLCWMPNFAFSYLAQRKDMMQATFSLRSMRAWVNCSEPVRHRSFTEFAQQFRDWGVSLEHLQASYAMAENVFAVTQSTGGAPRTVARGQVQCSSVAYQAEAFQIIDDVYVSSGRCLEGMNVRIATGDCRVGADLEAGEIQLKTGCLFGGYWDGSGFSRAAFTADGWYRTGDFGFFEDGELFVIGRLKDIIIVAGQNIFPEDIEAITAQVQGVRAGRVVAFAMDDEALGTQSIAVVAEMSGDFDRAQALEIEREVRRLITASLGVAARFVRIVPQRWVVKSTAGKISRRDTRTRFLSDMQPSTVPSLHAARS
jgi:acyl-CoA synthetase (AMP-forming)/AMP-acid ligase II